MSRFNWLPFFLLFGFSLMTAHPAHLRAQESTEVSGEEKKTHTKKKSAKNIATNEDKEAETKTKKKKKKPKPFKWVNQPGEKHPAMVKHKTFLSPSLKVDVGYCILFPPGYHRSKEARFPVVYYLHGGRPGSELKSVQIGVRVHKFMKDGDVSPAIYVFVNGGPVSHYNMPDDPKAQGADVFINELIPHVDKTYRTIANRNARGIEGFSQGGRGTMRLSLRHPDLFCSAAPGGGGYETEKRISEEGGYESPTLKFAKGDNVWDLARAYVKHDESAPKVSWQFHVGTKGINYKNNLEYMKYLELLGVPFERVIVPDAPHSASKIYDEKGLEIARFHAANFVRAQTLDNADGIRQVPLTR